jgi:NADH:ubiquinone oxidoreductase subunit B-like Fe-S oxidoreductase
MFRESYNWTGPVQDYIPVDAFVAGCPPKPEAMIAALMKLVTTLRES